MPANYVLRAIPLAAGEHRLRLIYEPLYFHLGLWVSALSSCALLAIGALAVTRVVIPRRPPG